jgi:hypothetical protein
MAQAHETRTTGGEPNTIGTGWRIFQVLALLTALSWLGSFLLFSEPYGWVAGLFAGELPEWGTLVFDLSPIVSIILILLAVAPGQLRFMEGDDWKAYLVRAVVLVLPALWMLNVFVGPRQVMIDKLIATPLDPSNMIPLWGGVFLHVVMQHWFQSIAAIAFALVPEQFDTLVESPTPAGVQCAVVECE